MNSRVTRHDTGLNIGADEIKIGHGNALWPILHFPEIEKKEENAHFFIAPVEPRYISSYLYSHKKRAIDIVVAFLILIVIIPLLLQIAFIVKVTSSGPVIFRQKRRGAGLREFDILKFRTMVTADEVDIGFLRQASRGDPRVTQAGRWLRRLSLDELPQLINVIRGEMSLVGPRPHALSHDLYYSDHIAGYSNRYVCRPGMTGLAQICGARGETSQHSDMQRRIDFDLHYIRHASARYDLAIIWKTVLGMFRPGEAY